MAHRLFPGSLIGVIRTLPNKYLRFFGTAYVELFRNVPLLVQMFIWFYVLPELVGDDLGRWMKRDMPFPEVTSAILCLGTYTASRVAEQVRAGIESIPRGQVMAGYAMGMTTKQVYQYLLIPVGYRIIVPPMTSEFLTIFKKFIPCPYHWCCRGTLSGAADRKTIPSRGSGVHGGNPDLSGGHHDRGAHHGPR